MYGRCFRECMLSSPGSKYTNKNMEPENSSVSRTFTVPTYVYFIYFVNPFGSFRSSFYDDGVYFVFVFCCLFLLLLLLCALSNILITNSNNNNISSSLAATARSSFILTCDGKWEILAASGKYCAIYGVKNTQMFRNWCGAKS